MKLDKPPLHKYSFSNAKLLSPMSMVDEESENNKRQELIKV